MCIKTKIYVCRRAKQVKDLLLRSVSLELNADMEAKEKFLTERLMIPEKWIFEAKVNFM